MVSLSSWFFSDEIKDGEQEAEKMLEFAKNCDTNNPVYKMVYLANQCRTGDIYNKAVKEARPVVEQKYKGEDFFDTYFKSVLSR